MVKKCEKTTGAGGSDKSEGRRLKSVFLTYQVSKTW